MDLRNIFKKRKSLAEQAIEETTPQRDLFVDDKIPSEEKVQRKDSQVSRFLAANHFEAGLYAGYHLHCHDGLKENLERLRSSFRLAVDDGIQESEKEQLKLEMAKIQFGDMLESQRKCLELSLDHRRKVIEEARMQKVLSVDNEGWISSAITEFKLGFNKGMLDYFTEQELFTK